MSQWVQHVSGHGEKWKVNQNYDYVETWVVYGSKNETGGYASFYLPKSEYDICDPPEVIVERRKS